MNFTKIRLTNQEIEMAYTDHMTNIKARTLILVFMIQISNQLSNNYLD